MTDENRYIAGPDGTTIGSERNTYKCDACGGVFDKGWDDAEALAEQKDLFGFVPPPEEQGLVCDECFNKFMERRTKRIGGSG